MENTSVSLNMRDLRYIIYRNFFLLTNGIIFGVVLLLVIFGNIRAGIFLGIIVIANISFGLFQDIRAWRALQKLQLLTAPHVIRIGLSGQEESILAEKIQIADRVKLKTGDQIPCDGTLLEAANFEINEGLITGESDSIPRKIGEQILAGSVVTSGSGIIHIDTAFFESRIARMTGGIKKYSLNKSPIQRSVDVVITFSGYLLVGTLVFAIGRGIFVHETVVDIVLHVGTLTSMIVPQGLVFTVTLFFAYGAVNLFRKNVLLQEVNATEKLGRIKNLCMDKTGTITENILSVKEIVTPNLDTREEAMRLASAYIQGTGDTSQIMNAIKIFIDRESKDKYVAEISDSVSFSSWRQYGAVSVKNSTTSSELDVFVGPPQKFLPHISNDKETQWLSSLLLAHSNKGEHILCVMSRDKTKDKSTKLENFADTPLSIVAVFVFYNNLREGIRDTIDFFQNRGVIIRIISGDNPLTTSAIAAAAGIKNSDKVITGAEIKNWNEKDFPDKVKLYSIFANIVPEQKRQIVEAFKKDGFTAMIGDGANDALAIKKADLGIAMFDGAPAVRELASVVLTNNSFAALPGGVELADSIIKYIEMFATMFINQSIIGFLFFLVVSGFNHAYPLTPFNITLINYFTIGIPGLLISYWAIYPSRKVPPVNKISFLKRIVPFAFSSAIIQALGVGMIFILALKYLPVEDLNTAVTLAFIVFGFAFFVFVPKTYQGSVSRTQTLQILSFGIFELFLLIGVFQIPALTTFFTITPPSLSPTTIVLILLALSPFYLIQYGLAKWYGPKRS